MLRVKPRHTKVCLFGWGSSLQTQISTAYIENRLEGLKLCKRLKLSENWVEPSSFLPYTAWVQVGPTALIENLMISVRCFRHIVKFRGRASERLTFNLIVFFYHGSPLDLTSTLFRNQSTNRAKFRRKRLSFSWTILDAILKEKHSLFCLRNLNNIAKHNPAAIWKSIYFTRVWK